MARTRIRITTPTKLGPESLASKFLPVQVRQTRPEPDPRLALLGGVGLGAGLSYFLDPERGNRRRALVRNKTVHAVSKTRHAVDVTSRDVANRTKGAVIEARSRLAPEEIDDEVLVDRVRSKLGQLVSHPSAIEVGARDGTVTLSGPVLADEVTLLLAGVPTVRGVTHVDNRLDVHEHADNVPGLQGEGRRPRRIKKENWSPTARLAGVSIGGGLISLAARRRDFTGAGAGVVGVALAARGITNIPLTRLTGIGTKRRGIDVQTTINIDAPVERVFEFWTDYENFPRWMSNVREVKPLEQERSRWTVSGPAGTPIMFDAEVSVFNSNERFGWRTAEGSAIQHSGLVEFTPTPEGSTRVQIRMTYNPVVGGIGHVVAALLGADPKKKIDEDMVRLKTLIETGRQASDAAQPH